MSLSPAKEKFVELASTKHGVGAVLNKDEVHEIVLENEIGWPSWFSSKHYRINRGEWKLPTETEIKTGTPSVPLDVVAKKATSLSPAPSFEQTA